LRKSIETTVRESALSRWLTTPTSDPGDDLDPSFVHRLKPLSLLLRILVWDGADEVVALTVFVDLARVLLDAVINLPDLCLTS
jgi:hypothetical protein